jgi:hypothetical protein
MNLGFLRSFGGPSFQKGLLRVSKYAPEILTGVGIAGVVTSTVLIARASTKVEVVMMNHDSRIADAKFQKVEQILDDTRGEVHEDSLDLEKVKLEGKELLPIYAHTSLDILKLYGPGVSMSAGSIIAILAAHGIMKRRTVALMGAYKAVESAFSAYRQRVIEEFGDEKDRDFRLGFRTEKIKDEETGKSTVVRRFDPNHTSLYARFFDEGNPNWVNDPEYNLMFLKNMQSYMNDKLMIRGYLFLNDVYDALGMERSSQGQVVGWVVDPSNNGDLYVDFNIYNADSSRARDFVNGLESSILLDFNVDGPILDLIDEIRENRLRK